MKGVLTFRIFIGIPSYPSDGFLNLVRVRSLELLVGIRK